MEINSDKNTLENKTSRLQNIAKILNTTIIPDRWMKLLPIALWISILFLFIALYIGLQRHTYADIMGSPSQNNGLINTFNVRLHIYKDIGGDFRLGQELHIKQIGNLSPNNCKITLNTEYVSSFDGLLNDMYHGHEHKRWSEEREFILQFDHDFTNVGFFKNSEDKMLPRQQQIKQIGITCNEGTGEWIFPDIVTK